MTPTRPTRARLAALAAAALLAAALPAPAVAAPGDEATISGTVTLPPGLTEDDEIAVDAYVWKPEYSSWYLIEYAEVDPLGDGSYTIEGLVEGETYRLGLSLELDGYLGGYYPGPGMQLRSMLDDAVGVTAPRTGVAIDPVVATSVTATYSLPTGYDWELGSFGIYAMEPTPDLEGVAQMELAYASEESAGVVSIGNLRPGSDYVIGVFDNPSRSVGGAYHANVTGLIESNLFATPVRAGSSIHLALRTSFAEPRLSTVTAPVVSGKPAIGERLSVTTGSWSMFNVATSVQWLRDGAAIPGATSSSYTLTAADRGKRISARVTGSREHVPSASVTTAVTAPVAGLPAPKATTAPQVSGTFAFGSALKALPGTWDTSGVTLTYQWLRAGKAVSGATSSTYTLTAGDIAQSISVRVTATREGYEPGVATSAAKKVTKGKPTVTATVKPVKAGKRAKVKVTVAAAGMPKPNGTVKVKYGKKTVKATLKASAKGKITVKLPALAKGRYAVKVTFVPSTKSKKLLVNASAAKTTLRVR